MCVGVLGGVTSSSIQSSSLCFCKATLKAESTRLSRTPESRGRLEEVLGACSGRCRCCCCCCSCCLRCAAEGGLGSPSRSCRLGRLLSFWRCLADFCFGDMILLNRSCGQSHWMSEQQNSLSTPAVTWK